MAARSSWEVTRPTPSMYLTTVRRPRTESAFRIRWPRGMTLVSATPSTGSCVTTANPITCSLGTLASGASDTITVVETASAAGSFANTATVSDSGTPPDPNTGNNAYVAVATVQSAACASTSQASPGTNLTGVLNTYYPGSASVAAGTTSITVGAANRRWERHRGWKSSASHSDARCHGEHFEHGGLWKRIYRPRIYVAE